MSVSGFELDLFDKNSINTADPYSSSSVPAETSKVEFGCNSVADEKSNETV